ncbi:MAG TPA: hypothetical protein VEL76_31990, partial [Gemmataceae bacterium]|nr:hypothetical protein [Gemmataceae bacterium]
MADAVKFLRRRYNNLGKYGAQAVTTRAEWQQLAEDRILDARAHLDPAVARWSAAYYLVGYAVECGLKACVLVHVVAHPEVIYEDRKFSQSAWTHDLEVLVALAGLKAVRDADTAANPIRYKHWQKLNAWSEEARYLQKTQAEAQRLFDAVADPVNGVMQWIR